MAKSRGFTMIELVMVIVILGILAVVALPRMGGLSDFRALEFHDQVVSALRHAKNSASSHRRLVCVAFTATTVTLTIARANPSAACDDPLTLPGSNASVVQSHDTTNVFFNPLPAAFNFLPDGTGADRNLAIAGQTPIVVTGATGYVQ